MDERLVTQLETAVADAGALLVRAQKYRRGAGEEGSALLRAALALGDEARRLSRRDALDDAAATALRAEADALAARVRALLASIQAAPEYIAAVAAHAAGDQATLAEALPAVFAGLEPVADAPDLFHVVGWRRRNRPRRAPDVAEELLGLRDRGLPADGDDLSPGADAALPAVVLATEAPADEPVVVRVAAGTVAVPVYRLVETGEHLVYVPHLRVPLAVVLATTLGPDALESAPVDYARYRSELAAAFAAAGIPFADT